MSTPDPGRGGRGGGRRGSGGKRGAGQPRAAVTSKQDALLTALLPPPATYDKAKADTLKITVTGSSAAHRVNTVLAPLAVMQREGGIETNTICYCLFGVKRSF